MRPLITLENITKNYGDITALDQVSLEVRQGEILTIAGPNGSGKTTMLRIMAFIETPTSGEVYFNGAKVNDENRSQIRTKCTMVLQKTALFNTTVYKNVAYGLKLRRFSKKEIDERVKDALDLVKLNGYEKRLAKKLSGGEQQRVSLARALVLNTELLLLDEPTANLDPKNMSIIEEIVSEISWKHKNTVVMATHNLFQAETITKRAALLLGGKIVEIGTVQEIFRTPSKHFASFARLENVFSGTSRVLKEGTSLIDVGDGVEIEAALRESGKIWVFVRPEDIILSRKPISSSARNVFKGRVVEISDLESVMMLKVDAGKQFVVQITKRSFNEMQLNVRSEVFLTFKASSVHVV